MQPSLNQLYTLSIIDN